MSTKQIQSRLRYKNIVVTGLEHPTMQFDKAGLRGLCALDRTISIQGMGLTLQYDWYMTDLVCRPLHC